MRPKFLNSVFSSKILGLAAGVLAATLAFVLFVRTPDGNPNGLYSSVGLTKEAIAAQLGASIQKGEFPDVADIEVDGVLRKAMVEYALVRESQARVQKLFDSYQPDFGAFVALDARTGRILSMVSYSREREDGRNLALQATFPAASVFKVVTAGAAIDGGSKATSDTVVTFNGSNHTLYKKNVNDTRVTRWTRRMTIRDAFAHSVNTVFSKLGLFYVGPSVLRTYAERFQFNRRIRADVPVEQGKANFAPEDPWSIATAASGFTQDNTMSPLQGALIAAAVANDGVMMEPYLVERIQAESGQSLYQAEEREASIALEPSSAAELRELMRETVKTGTSRKAFRQALRKRQFEDVEFGGKTGSLTGTNPVGKCDWFVGYARYRDTRIAVAALTVNEKKWRVKSSTLASEFLSNYVRGQKAREEFATYVHPSSK